MVAGPSLDRHHWVPRAEGGRDRAWVHLVCHRMVHRLFADHELAGPLPRRLANRRETAYMAVTPSRSPGGDANR